MTEHQEDLLLTALLSAPRALWDVVTPDLRAVSLSVVNGLVRSRFIYSEPPDAMSLELMNDAEGELAADLPWGIRTSFAAGTLPPPNRLELLDGEIWAFQRREGELEAVPDGRRKVTAGLALTTRRILACDALQIHFATRGLRAITVNASEDHVRGRLVYDHQPTQAEHRIAAEAADAVRATLPEDSLVEFVADHLAPSKRRELMAGESWLFLRYEDDHDRR